jgi:hypothetical protein
MLFNMVLFLLLRDSMKDGFANVNKRFDDMRDLWRAGLRRVEDVLGARLKHIERHVSERHDRSVGPLRRAVRIVRRRNWPE